MNIRLCLGCKHMSFESATFWQSDMSSGGEPAQFVCGKRHWLMEIGYDPDMGTFEQHLFLANTCPDFEERA